MVLTYYSASGNWKTVLFQIFLQSNPKLCWNRQSGVPVLYPAKVSGSQLLTLGKGETLLFFSHESHCSPNGAICIYTISNNYANPNSLGLPLNWLGMGFGSSTSGPTSSTLGMLAGPEMPSLCPPPQPTTCNVSIAWLTQNLLHWFWVWCSKNSITHCAGLHSLLVSLWHICDNPPPPPNLDCILMYKIQSIIQKRVTPSLESPLKEQTPIVFWKNNICISCLKFFLETLTFVPTWEQWKLEK